MENANTIRSLLQSMRSAMVSFLLSEISNLRKVWAYNPGRHYMRGPGPKWREKHAVIRIANTHGEPPMRIDGCNRIVTSR